MDKKWNIESMELNDEELEKAVGGKKPFSSLTKVNNRFQCIVCNNYYTDTNAGVLEHEKQYNHEPMRLG